MGKKGKGRKGKGKGKGLPLAMDPDTLWLQQLGVMTASDGKSGNLECRVANVMRIEDPAEQNGDKGGTSSSSRATLYKNEEEARYRRGTLRV